MNDLSRFYGKELHYILTEIRNGKIEQSNTVKKVYNPLDFKNCRVRPCNGSDLVIGNNSANSKYIFSIGGIMKTSLFNDKYFSVTVFNYCEASEVETVKKLHIKELKNAFSRYITEKSELINKAKNILINI